MSKERKNKNKENENNSMSIEKIKKQIYLYSESSLDIENDREKYLLEHSNSNLTVVSILLVAILNITFELLDRLHDLSLIISIFSIILISFLLISILFSFKARWLYKKKYRKSGKELVEHINKNLKEYHTMEYFYDQNINDFSEMCSKLEKNNKKRQIDLMISSAFIYAFLILVFAFGIVILIVL